MKKTFMITILMLAAFMSNCAGIELIPSSGIEDSTVTGESVQLRYISNSIQQTIPGIGETPACVRTFFQIVVAVKNTGDQPLTLDPQDFTLIIDDDEKITSLARSEFCERFHTATCAPAIKRLQELKQKDEQAWSMAVAMNNSKINSCANNLRPVIASKDGRTLEPGQEHLVNRIIFFDDKFDKRFFYEHVFKVQYKDLAPFVLADEDFYELLSEQQSAQ